MLKSNSLKKIKMTISDKPKNENQKYISNKKEKVKELKVKENEKAEFKYDFGDNWRLNIVLEKIFKDENIVGRELPRVIVGEGFGILD